MNDYQNTLEAEKENLISELQTIATQDQISGDWVAKPAGLQTEADQNSSADNTEDWNERRALVAQLETRYHNVLLALAKCSAGTYGTCELCREEIEKDRLAVNPAARTCKLHLERERELPL
jgi:RNA polymerase-binding transcription factor DksA